MAWWLWALVCVLLGGASVMAAMLSLSAGTALGHDYHTMTERQRWMGKALYRLSLLAVPVLAAAGLAAAWMAVRSWLA